ncbi:hypothetical protein LXA43DRAFT_1151863, partial [Ganoderma leucocontextum]
VYDWVGTLPHEVQLFWNKKARPLSAILYFSNKYLNLLAQVINLLDLSALKVVGDCSCARVILVDSTFLYLAFLPPAAFAGLRAYTLTRRRWLSALVFLLSSTSFATNMVFFGFDLSAGTQVPMMGCEEHATIPPSLVIPWTPPRNVDMHSTVFITNRISTILADTFLVAITWKQFLREGVSMKNNLEIMKKKGLVWIMLCDASMIYFVVLLMLNITHLVLTELSVSARLSGALLLFRISSVLVSRFLLDLQEAHQIKVVGLDTNDPLHTLQNFGIRSINLPPALGSLGATIDPASYSWTTNAQMTTPRPRKVFLQVKGSPARICESKRTPQSRMFRGEGAARCLLGSKPRVSACWNWYAAE